MIGGSGSRGGGREETLYRLPAPPGARAAVAWRVAAWLALGAADGGWLASSYMARRLGYAARLGSPWLVRPWYPDRWLLAAFLAVVAAGAGMALFAASRRGALLLVPLGVPLLLGSLGPLYGPLRAIAWIHAYGRLPGLAAITRAAAAIGAIGMLACFASTAAYGAWSLGRLRRVGDLHGSSHWASRREVAAAGLLAGGGGGEGGKGAKGGKGGEAGGGEGGIVVGRLGKRLLVDRKDRHALVYAPSGTGKSSCLVIPTLLRWPASVLAFDVKGELWQRTAGYRQSRGQRVLRFDPTLPRGSAGYNPLLAIPRSEEDVAAAQDVADVLVNPEGRETTGGERFFEDSARALLTGVILHVLYTERPPSLGACLRLLSSPKPAEVWTAMRTAPHDDGERRGWRDRETGKPSGTHPAVANAASRLLGMDFRTATSVQATAQSKLVLFEDPLVCRNTAASDFRGEDLIAGPLPVSVYLTVAPSDLDRMRPLLRIVLNQVSRELTRELRHDRRPVLLMLDELTALGRLDFMHRGIGYFRGYQVRVFLSIQSLEQLFQIYGQHQSIGANCGVQIAYGANDVATAKLLSEMTGRRTVEYRRESRGGGIFGGRRSESDTEAGRPLLSPDEVRRLPDDEALIYVAGCAPIRGARVPYWRDPELARRAAMPPPTESEQGME
ncbi:MAG TPA: type IV secretory system conjugative DNA transfer family protein [Thermoanaerobaculia bacterium]|nr:type IV secretory system conjugative DNA transfer family protein [Thermoanaerobaculia bacterium]